MRLSPVSEIVIGDLEGNLSFFLNSVSQATKTDKNSQGLTPEEFLADGGQIFLMGDLWDGKYGPAIQVPARELELSKLIKHLQERYPNNLIIIDGNRDINKARFLAEVPKTVLASEIEAIEKNQHQQTYQINETTTKIAFLSGHTRRKALNTWMDPGIKPWFCQFLIEKHNTQQGEEDKKLKLNAEETHHDQNNIKGETQITLKSISNWFNELKDWQQELYYYQWVLQYTMSATGTLAALAKEIDDSSIDEEVVFKAYKELIANQTEIRSKSTLCLQGEDFDLQHGAIGNFFEIEILKNILNTYNEKCNEENKGKEKGQRTKKLKWNTYINQIKSNNPNTNFPELELVSDLWTLNKKYIAGTKEFANDLDRVNKNAENISATQWLHAQLYNYFQGIALGKGAGVLAGEGSVVQHHWEAVGLIKEGTIADTQLFGTDKILFCGHTPVGNRPYAHRRAKSDGEGKFLLSRMIIRTDISQLAAQDPALTSAIFKENGTWHIKGTAQEESYHYKLDPQDILQGVSLDCSVYGMKSENFADLLRTAGIKHLNGFSFAGFNTETNKYDFCRQNGPNIEPSKNFTFEMQSLDAEKMKPVLNFLKETLLSDIYSVQIDNYFNEKVQSETDSVYKGENNTLSLKAGNDTNSETDNDNDDDNEVDYMLSPKDQALANIKQLIKAGPNGEGWETLLGGKKITIDRTQLKGKVPTTIKNISDEINKYETQINNEGPGVEKITLEELLEKIHDHAQGTMDRSKKWGNDFFNWRYESSKIAYREIIKQTKDFLPEKDKNEDDTTRLNP